MDSALHCAFRDSCSPAPIAKFHREICRANFHFREGQATPAFPEASPNGAPSATGARAEGQAVAEEPEPATGGKTGWT